LAKNLGVSLNDAIQVISLSGPSPPWDDAQDEAFPRRGHLLLRMYEYDNTMGYVSIEGAQKFFGMGARVSGIEIKTHNIYKVKEIGQELRKKTGFSVLDEGLDGDAPKSLFRDEAREDYDVHYSCPDHPGGRLQHHLHADHGGDGKI